MFLCNTKLLYLLLLRCLEYSQILVVYLGQNIIRAANFSCIYFLNKLLLKTTRKQHFLTLQIPIQQSSQNSYVCV